MLSPLAAAWMRGRRCASHAGDVVEQRRRGRRRRMRPARPGRLAAHLPAPPAGAGATQWPGDRLRGNSARGVLKVTPHARTTHATRPSRSLPRPRRLATRLARVTATPTLAAWRRVKPGQCPAMLRFATCPCDQCCTPAAPRVDAAPIRGALWLRESTLRFGGY